tara:strand:- start:26 stop:445 length:420 start_codon:yes stop_codon:yes gene_type:complete
MIKYNLKCNNKHEFESWFSDSKEFEKLSKKKLLECIFCNSKIIKKSIMSPRILNSNKNENGNPPELELKKLKKDLINLRKFVEKNFEFVGSNLANKVRDVYYDKKSNKNIYGSTSEKEREELKEEGIDLVSIPWIEKDN